MSHSEICPVCGGTGKIKQYNTLFSPFGFNSSSGHSYIKKTCHGCKGKGWICVKDEQWQPPYYYRTNSDTKMSNHTTIEREV